MAGHTHNKDVLVSEWTSEFKGIPFATNSGHWNRNRLQSQYRIANRRLPSVLRSYTGEQGNMTFREVSDYDKRMLNLHEHETAVIASEAGNRFGTLFILSEVTHRRQGHPQYFDTQS